ncbi:hypothetical protein [Micromonospora sp. NPDC005979]|uniref:hypothetical protein n=1 Tax=Micromonospora sp. NPDC005979 TaxID=3156726 RepID=UPI0033A426AA
MQAAQRRRQGDRGESGAADDGGVAVQADDPVDLDVGGEQAIPVEERGAHTDKRVRVLRSSGSTGGDATSPGRSAEDDPYLTLTT